MPLGDEFSGEGIEALLARTRRQISIFILGATALVVAVVGVGGAVAGNSALDAGLDNALLARADRIVLEIQEYLPPLPDTSPGPGRSPTPSASPEGSEGPGESESPEEHQSPDPSGGLGSGDWARTQLNGSTGRIRLVGQWTVDAGPGAGLGECGAPGGQCDPK